MIGPLGVHVDICIPDTGKETMIDEAIIEMRLGQPVRRIDPAVAIGRQPAEPCQKVDRLVAAQSASVKAVITADHGDIFGRLGLHVEIAHQQKILGQRQARKTMRGNAGQRTALGRKIESPILEEGNLGNALVRRDMIEMNGINANCAFGRVDHDLDGTALQVDMLDTVAARQKQVAHGKDRPARQDHIAELETALPAPAVFGHHVEQDIATGAIRDKEVREQILKGSDHIDMAIVRRSPGNLLQRDNIGTTKAFCDAFEIIFAIEAKSVLDVIADELHDNL